MMPLQWKCISCKITNKGKGNRYRRIKNSPSETLAGDEATAKKAIRDNHQSRWKTHRRNDRIAHFDFPKSIAEDMENKATKAEWQLKYAEQDAIIENAEVVGYGMLIQWAIKVYVDKVMPVLMQNLKEEEDMRMWLRANTPRLFAESWRRIEEETDADMKSGVKESRRKK
jgi:hypothetical protein